MPNYNDGPAMRRFITRQMRADHHQYEQMARRVRDPGRVGCWTGAAEDGLEDHLSVNVYRPRNPTKPPVLAFGNTRVPDALASPQQFAEFLSDLEADFDALEIGAYRWAYNDGRIKGLLDSLTNEYQQKVVLTGHSLGGALAQITACNYWPQVHSVVTFQSPRIGRSYRKLRGRLTDGTAPDDTAPDDTASRSFHYQLEEDNVITDAGELHSPGSVVEFRWAPSRVAQFADAAAELVQQIAPAIPEIGEAVAAVVAALRAIGAALDDVIQAVLAHLTLFFEPFLGLTDPERQIDPDALRREYRQIREDPANHGARLDDGTIEWLRRNASQLMVAAGFITLGPSMLAPASGHAVERVNRVLFVLIWDYLKQRIDGDIARGRRPSRRLADLEFPIGRVHSGLPSLPLDASSCVRPAQHEQIRLNLAWIYPSYFSGGRGGPIVPGPLVPPPPPPSPALLDDEGQLTDVGWSYLQQAPDITLDDGMERREMDDLLRGYFTGRQAQGARRRRSHGSYWLELLTAREAVLQFGAAPVNAADGGILAGATPGGGRVLVLVGKSIGRMFTFLASRNGRRLLPLPEGVIRNQRELRSWSVMRLLVQGIRRGDTRDQELEASYYNAHQYYLRCRRSDPLALIAPDRLRGLCCSVAPATFTLDEFLYFAWRYRALALRDREAERLLRQRPASASEAAQASRQAATGPWTWFNFLFKSEPRGEGDFAGEGFVAGESSAVRSCVERPGLCAGPLEEEEHETEDEDDGAPEPSGRSTVKALVNKRPDVVQIFVNEQRVEVLDVSFRWHEAWHNFKTQFYCAALRAALPGWQVAGLDYRTARRSRLV